MKNKKVSGNDVLSLDNLSFRSIGHCSGDGFVIIVLTVELGLCALRIVDRYCLPTIIGVERRFVTISWPVGYPPPP